MTYGGKQYVLSEQSTFRDSPFGAVVEGNITANNLNFELAGGVTQLDGANGAVAFESNSRSFFSPDSENPDLPNIYELATESPLRDAGSANSLYNDLDGSRNDVGASGGPRAP